jgi:hypothetical protein
MLKVIRRVDYFKIRHQVSNAEKHLIVMMIVC